MPVVHCFNLRFAIACAFSLLATLALAGVRPDTIKVIDGAVELRSIVYAPGTPEDVTQPASGHGKLTFLIPIPNSTSTVAVDGVPFSDLKTDASGKITGLTLTLGSPVHLNSILGTGTDLLIPSGRIDFNLPNKIQMATTCTLTFPFRCKDGSRVQADIASLAGQTDTTGKSTLVIQGASLKGPALQEGLRFPGLNIKPGVIAANLAWAPNQPLTWTATSPSATIGAGLPGTASDPEYPLTGTVTNVVVSQDGSASFSEADVNVTNVAFKLSEAPGFDFTIKSGNVHFVGATPTAGSITLDVTLPPGMTTDIDGSSARATIKNLSAQVDDGGWTVAADRIGVDSGNQDNRGNPKFRVGAAKFSVTGFGLDFSTTRALANAPPDAAAPNWVGCVIKAGTADIPVGIDKITIGCTDFLVESQGVSGKFTVQPGQQLVSGFPIQVTSGAVEFKRNQLKQADLAGSVKVGDFGTINATTSFNLEGKASFAVSSGQSLNMASVAVNLKQLKGNLDKGHLVLSGVMGIDAQKVAIPDYLSQLSQFEIGFTGLGVASDGTVTLPASGYITFPDPKTLNVGPLGIEVRRVGFTTENNVPSSITLTGGASLKGLGDLVPVAGELDFEGLKIENENGAPKVTLGGIGFHAEITGLGTFGASLGRLDPDSLPKRPANAPSNSTEGFSDEDIRRIKDFGPNTFAGDATFKLTCLPVQDEVNIEFLIAPDKKALFLGGGFQPPTPILVQIPPAPPAIPAPIPLFTILGFSGGIGINVIPASEGQGRISDPLKQLKFQAGSGMLQIGLLVADPVPGAPGRIWWADTALTGTINPVTIDFTARAAFLDPTPANPTFVEDLSDWEALDRIASIFLNLDLSTPAFTMGGSADLTFPTRNASLMNASGEAKLRISKTEAFIRIGWPPSDPVKVEAGGIAKNFADITAQAGLNIDIKAHKAQFFFDADAQFDVGVASVDGHLGGTLDLNDVGSATKEFNADGTIGLDATVDFGLFTASVDASLAAEFNTPAHHGELYLNGTLHGKVGIFEADVDVEKHIQVK